MAKKVSKKAASAAKKAPTKSELYTAIAEDTGLTKKDIAAVFDSLDVHIKKSLSPRGAQEFTLPGLAKIKVKKKPATKARMGINPFTKEEQMFAAKPASKTVKLTPLKNLKDMV